MQQWSLEQAAPQGRGIWKEQRCETWHLGDVVAPRGTGTCRHQRHGGTVFAKSGAEGGQHL